MAPLSDNGLRGHFMRRSGVPWRDLNGVPALPPVPRSGSIRAHLVAFYGGVATGSIPALFPDVRRRRTF
jgi:hypothetical protein